MSKPRDIKEVSQRYRDFIKRHQAEMSPVLDASEEPGHIGDVARVYRAMMSSFSQHIRVLLQKLRPDDFQSNEPLHPETEELLGWVRLFLNDG